MKNANQTMKNRTTTKSPKRIKINNEKPTIRKTMKNCGFVFSVLCALGSLCFGFFVLSTFVLCVFEFTFNASVRVKRKRGTKF